MNFNPFFLCGLGFIAMFSAGCSTTPKSNYTGYLNPPTAAVVAGLPSSEADDVRFIRINRMTTAPYAMDQYPNAVRVLPGLNVFVVRASGHNDIRELAFPCERGKTYLIELKRTRENDALSPLAFIVREASAGSVILTDELPVYVPTYSDYSPNTYTAPSYYNFDSYKSYQSPEPPKIVPYIPPPTWHH